MSYLKIEKLEQRAIAKKRTKNARFDFAFDCAFERARERRRPTVADLNEFGESNWNEVRRMRTSSAKSHKALAAWNHFTRTILCKRINIDANDSIIFYINMF